MFLGSTIIFLKGKLTSGEIECVVVPEGGVEGHGGDLVVLLVRIKVNDLIVKLVDSVLLVEQLGILWPCRVVDNDQLVAPEGDDLEVKEQGQVRQDVLVGQVRIGGAI